MMRDSQAPLRVLVVDRDPGVARDVASMLEHLGHEVAGATTSPDEAARIVERERPHAALVDVAIEDPWSLPDPAGRGHLRDRVAILYTVEEDDASLGRIRASHPGGYLLKPIAERELRWGLAALLEEGGPGAAGAFAEDFFDLSIDMLCCLGFDGYFARLNPAWERVLGFTREELMSRPFIEFVHPDDRERTLRQNREVRNGGHAHGFENRYLCKDGSYRWLLWNAAPNLAREAIYSVARDVTERRRAEEALERLSTTDELTGLWNRRGLAALADRELERAVSRSACALLFYIDLDRFKEINDAFGHAAGDRVLEDVARLLRESCRGSDVVARVGGDEFVVLALDENGEGERIITERILQAVRRLNETKRHPCEVALTMGSVSLRPGEQADLQMLLTRADERMYLDKRRKRRLRAG